MAAQSTNSTAGTKDATTIGNLKSLTLATKLSIELNLDNAANAKVKLKSKRALQCRNKLRFIWPWDSRPLHTCGPGHSIPIQTILPGKSKSSRFSARQGSV